MQNKKISEPPPSCDFLASFIEGIVGQLDDRIVLVDRDLVNGDVIVLFDNNVRFKITVC